MVTHMHACDGSHRRVLLVESEGPDPSALYGLTVSSSASYLLFLGLGFFTYNIDCHLFYLQKCTGLCVSGGVSRTGTDCVRITSTLAKKADTWAPCRCPEPEAAGRSRVFTFNMLLY